MESSSSSSYEASLPSNPLCQCERLYGAQARCTYRHGYGYVTVCSNCGGILHPQCSETIHAQHTPRRQSPPPFPQHHSTPTPDDHTSWPRQDSSANFTWGRPQSQREQFYHPYTASPTRSRVRLYSNSPLWNYEQLPNSDPPAAFVPARTLEPPIQNAEANWFNASPEYTYFPQADRRLRLPAIEDPRFWVNSRVPSGSHHSASSSNNSPERAQEQGQQHQQENVDEEEEEEESDSDSDSPISFNPDGSICLLGDDWRVPSREEALREAGSPTGRAEVHSNHVVDDEEGRPCSVHIGENIESCDLSVSGGLCMW